MAWLGSYTRLNMARQGLAWRGAARLGMVHGRKKTKKGRI